MKETDVSVPVHCHEKRPEWGMALLVWEQDEKRGYLFEDGTLRVIAERFYRFMAVKSVEHTSLSEAFRQQISQMSEAAADGMLDPKREVSPLFSVEEQAQLLVGQFADGFSGVAWRKRHRGDGAKSHLKRHRDAVLAEAKKVLAPERIAVVVEEHRHEEHWRAIIGLLESTDLVSPTDVKALSQRMPRVTRGLTVALGALLHSPSGGAEDDGFPKRFSTFITELQRVLGRRPSWPLATSLLALWAPAQHVCVHPTSLRQQSKWLGDRPLQSNSPNPRDYEAACTTAHQLVARLQELGLAPTDLLDVYDFVRMSTTPSAKKRMAVLRQSDLRNLAAEPSGSSSPEDEAVGSNTADTDADDADADADAEAA